MYVLAFESVSSSFGSIPRSGIGGSCGNSTFTFLGISGAHTDSRLLILRAENSLTGRFNHHIPGVTRILLVWNPECLCSSVCHVKWERCQNLPVREVGRVHTVMSPTVAETSNDTAGRTLGTMLSDGTKGLGVSIPPVSSGRGLSYLLSWRRGAMGL